MKVSTCCALLSLPLLTGFITSANAGTTATDSPTITVGMKMWQNKWSTWDAFPPYYDAAAKGYLPGQTENYSSSDRSAFIPAISIRYKDILVSGSYFAKTKYDWVGAGGVKFSADRKESDVLVGYYVLPTLALTLGYKNVKQTFLAGNDVFDYSGPVLGVVASAPLTSGFSLYGNFGYGFMDAKLPARTADQSGRSKFNADYLLSEIGVAYSFDTTSMPQAKAVTATLGYRSQVLATKGYHVGVSTANAAATIWNTRSTDLRDTTEGLSLGLSVSF